ncbi:MAG: hypothetical protein K2Q10_13935, partial [Rhodospirillales bacterium]|nr:hypothetical protein [Rhodospirillales bacterium]
SFLVFDYASAETRAGKTLVRICLNSSGTRPFAAIRFAKSMRIGSRHFHVADMSRSNLLPSMIRNTSDNPSS